MSQLILRAHNHLNFYGFVLIEPVTVQSFAKSMRVQLKETNLRFLSGKVNPIGECAPTFSGSYEKRGLEVR